MKKASAKIFLPEFIVFTVFIACQQSRKFPAVPDYYYNCKENNYYYCRSYEHISVYNSLLLFKTSGKNSQGVFFAFFSKTLCSFKAVVFEIGIRLLPVVPQERYFFSVFPVVGIFFRKNVFNKRGKACVSCFFYYFIVLPVQLLVCGISFYSCFKV